MDLCDPVERVLSIDEVLELILEYAASTESWLRSSKLRYVSKRWRSLSFRGLCQSKQLPTACIRDSKDFNWSDGAFEVSLHFLDKHFPITCPRKTTLTKPVLPIELNIQRYPTPAEICLVQKIASHIAAVRLEHQPVEDGDLFGVGIAEDQLDVPLQLPNLRSFHVSWLDAVGDPQFIKMVDLIGTNSKRLTHVEYEYHDDMYSNDLPSPPSNLTHISYAGDVLNLQKVLLGAVLNLLGLEFQCFGVNVVFDCTTLNEIVQKHSKTLRELRIRGPDELNISGAVELFQMDSLKTLKTDIPFYFKQAENSSYKPVNLGHLEYTITHWPENVPAVLEALRLSSSSLEYLTLNWTAEFRLYKSATADKLCEEIWKDSNKESRFVLI